MIFKLQRTDGMSDLLHRVLDGVCKVIHRIDTPFIPGIVMVHMGHPVDDRIPHVDIRRSHIDLRP